MTKDELKAEIAKLSLEDQLDLADELSRELHGDPEDFPLSAEQRAELERREAELERNPEACVPWEVVLERLKSRRRG